MKKIYIVLAVLSTALLVSCQQEQEFSDLNIGEFDVAFSIANNATRALDVSSAVQQGAVIPLDIEESGRSLIMEEKIVDLDMIGAEPATKGTPAFTENLGVLYANQLAVYGTKGLFTTEKGYWNMDDNMTQGGWRYQGSYDSDPWPANTSSGEEVSVDFYFRMPSTQKNVTITSRSDGKFNFSYTSPATAKEQQDILFAYRPLTKSEHKANLKKGGTPILFNHALTGVKFAIGNEDDELANVGIRSITISGLINSGTCVLTPASEDDYRNEVDKDKNPTYSSKTAAVWTLGTTTSSFSSGTFDDPVTFENGGSFENNGKYGDSFAPANISNEKANTQNLNDTDGTQTFWFIPQAMTNNVKLTVEFTEDGGTNYRTFEIAFGKALGNVRWEAGELHTYTIKIDRVNVKIEDTVTLANPTQQYTGSTKQNVVITNTGNTDAYIRAAIIGQWLDSAGNPVFGFTDFTASANEQFVIVDSWYQDQFSATGQHKHGAFKNLVGYKNDTESGTPGSTVYTSDWWIKGSDGYYYFKYVVPVGKAVPETGTKYIAVTSSGTSEKTGGAPLFESYKIKDAPDARVAGKVEEIFFELEIATQAISAKKPNGTYYTLTEAWANAGITVTE